MSLNDDEFNTELKDLPDNDEFGFEVIELTVQYQVDEPLLYNIVGTLKGGSCFHNYCFGEEFPWLVYETKVISTKNPISYKFTLIPSDDDDSAWDTLEEILLNFAPNTTVYSYNNNKVKILKIEGKIAGWDKFDYEDYYYRNYPGF